MSHIIDVTKVTDAQLRRMIGNINSRSYDYLHEALRLELYRLADKQVGKPTPRKRWKKNG